MSMIYVVARDVSTNQQIVSSINSLCESLPEGNYHYRISGVRASTRERSDILIPFIYFLIELKNKKTDICIRTFFKYEYSSSVDSPYRLFFHAAMDALGINIIDYETLEGAEGDLTLGHLKIGNCCRPYVKEFQSMRISKKFYERQLKRWKLEYEFFDSDMKAPLSAEILEQAMAALNDPSKQCWLPEENSDNESAL